MARGALLKRDQDRVRLTPAALGGFGGEDSDGAELDRCRCWRRSSGDGLSRSSPLEEDGGYDGRGGGGNGGEGGGSLGKTTESEIILTRAAHVGGGGAQIVSDS